MLDPLTYNETESRREQHAAFVAEYDRCCPTQPPPKPPGNAWLNAIKLGSLAKELIEERDYLLNRSRGQKVWTTVSDTDEVRSICGKAAVALGPVIAETIEAKRKQEQLAAEQKEGEVQA